MANPGPLHDWRGATRQEPLFPSAAGYWSNVATVLSELTESLEPKLLAVAAERVPRSDSQRLGWLLDLLEERELAEAWQHSEESASYRPCSVRRVMRPEHPSPRAGESWSTTTWTRICDPEGERVSPARGLLNLRVSAVSPAIRRCVDRGRNRGRASAPPLRRWPVTQSKR